MIGDAPRSPHTRVPGWLENDEENAIVENARAIPEYGLAINIGVEYGRSMSDFVKYMPATAKVYGVDIAPLEAYTKNLLEAKLDPPPLIPGNSADPDTLKLVKKLIKTRSIDLLFIDGDHSYNGTLADLNIWTPLVKVGGKLLIHDVAVSASPEHPTHVPHELHHDVKRAIDVWKSQSGDNWQVVKAVHTLLILERIH